MSQKVFRTGNSLAVTVPSGFVFSVGVRTGDKVKVREQREKGKIIYQFSGTQQLPLDDLFLDKRRKSKKTGKK